ncbi:MAG: MIP/aquaporin family protein [Gemmatimonadales bacterium]
MLRSDRMTGPRPAAESAGTFFLVLIGPGAAAVTAWTHGGLGLAGVALAFGCVLVAAIYTLGHISGAHFSPAVTIAFGIGRRMAWRDVGPYGLAQLVGAVLAESLERMAVEKRVCAIGAAYTENPTPSPSWCW